MEPKWESDGTLNRPRGILGGVWEGLAKIYENRVPDGSQMGPKMDPSSGKFLKSFFEADFWRIGGGKRVASGTGPGVRLGGGFLPERKASPNWAALVRK